jgi:hypothetical protein
MRAPEDIVKGLPIRVWTGRAQGRRNNCEGAQESESPPLLRIQEPMSENELPAHGYGSTFDAEPSTVHHMGQGLQYQRPESKARSTWMTRGLFSKKRKGPFILY